MVRYSNSRADIDAKAAAPLARQPVVDRGKESEAVPGIPVRRLTTGQAAGNYAGFTVKLL